MKKEELEGLEADVVITIWNDMGQGAVCPLWECSVDYGRLKHHAEKATLAFVESVGMGSAQYEIHDFRTVVEKGVE